MKSIFEKLNQELKTAGVHDPQLHGRLQEASAQLANHASLIASWIRVPNMNIERKTYPMQKVVDISVAVVTGQRPGFKPIVWSQVPENFELDTYGFAVVVDMLYIALDNACQHSGKKVDNKIQIEIIFEKAKSILLFRIRSEVVPGIKTADKVARLEVIRGKIAKRAFGEGAHTEGRSGLLKLAALVLQSDPTDVTFDFVEETHFELKFSLIYVGANVEPSREN